MYTVNAETPTEHRRIPSGTANDYKICLADGLVDPWEPFTILTDEEAAEESYRYMKRVLLKTKHRSFWRGYETATADAAAALQPFEPKPSILSRIIGWLA
jgi:hypothetical protein